MRSTRFVMGLLVSGAVAVAGHATAAASDFAVTVHGPGHVVRGYDAFLLVGAQLVDGTSSDQLDLAVSGLPDGWAASWPDIEASCCGSSSAWRLPIATALHLETSEGTAPGTYPITVSVTEQNTGVMRSATFDLVVDPVPGAPTPGTLDLSPPIPMLSQWAADMTSYGSDHCDAAACGLADSCVWYYDGMRVYFQIADYTEDDSWEECAGNVESVYRDGYVIPNEGNVPGYRIFPHGLQMDWLRNGDEASRDAVLALEQNAAYSRSSIGSIIDTSRSREVAYNLNTKMIVEDLGEEASRTSVFADVALGHLDQWFVAGNYRDRIAPFMVGLTAEALIGWYERTGDPRVVSALEVALDWLWENAWIAGDQAFWYEWVRDGSPGTGGAPDLNGLLAPAYAWLYRQTGDARHRDRADAIFAGSVAGAYLAGGKQFSQSYRWTFDYLRWRTTPGEPAPADGGVDPSSDGGPAGSDDAGGPDAADAGVAGRGDAGARSDREMSGGCSTAGGTGDTPFALALLLLLVWRAPHGARRGATRGTTRMRDARER